MRDLLEVEFQGSIALGTLADAVGLRRGDIGPHDVADPGEVARLLAVAVDR